MATLKCLACGHDNSVGDQWCSSCSSSLNLRLCSACEAINANDAERCHSCNAQFVVEPEVAEPVAVELDLRPGAGAETAVYEFLPAPWQMPEEPFRSRRRTFAAALAVLPLLAAAAGAAYYFYPASPAAPVPYGASKVEAAEKSEPVPDREPAAKEPARPQTADAKPAQAPAVSGKIIAPRTATAPARGTPPSEPKRTTSAVTHTRAIGAETSSRTTAAGASTKTTATLPVTVTTVPASNGAILPVSESPAAIPEPKRTSVTHTKADLTESAFTTAAPAAATQVRTVAAEARSDEPAGCLPAVVALGLCKGR